MCDLFPGIGSHGIIMDLKFIFPHKYVFTIISQSEKSVDPYLCLVDTGKNDA